MKIKMFLLAVGILMSASAVSYAQTAEEIVSTYLETIGGEDAWKDINSMRVKGDALQMGMTYPFTVISMRPNLQKVIADVMGKEVIEAYDGEVAWTFNPFTGATAPQKKTEEESKEAAYQNFENDFINYAEKGYTVALEGEEEIEGTKCFKIKLAKEEDREDYYFFDAETFVPIMMRSYIQSGQMKGQAVEVYLSDYQEVEETGLIVAFSMKQVLNGQTFMEMTNKSFEFNAEDIASENFVFPEE